MKAVSTIPILANIGEVLMRLFEDNVAKELGFKEVTFTTKPEMMKVGYELYKRMGFEEVGEKDGIVSMRMSLLRTE